MRSQHQERAGQDCTIRDNNEQCKAFSPDSGDSSFKFDKTQ